MKAIITVIGADHVGIVAGVSAVLAEMNVNIMDLSQTIMGGVFTMTMLVDTSGSSHKFEEIRDGLSAKGTEMGMSIRIQRTDIFSAMHEI